MSGLHISPELDLPLDSVTETFAILAKRRAGKSNAAVVMAEEMYDNGLPWVAIDPKGDWSSGATGRSSPPTFSCSGPGHETATWLTGWLTFRSF